jgi:O-antigen ligase
MNKIGPASWLQSAPFLVLLAVIPFPHTAALRLVCVIAAFAVAIATWRRSAVPPVPCKASIVLWTAVALASLIWAFDRAYSLSEIKAEIGYSVMVYLAFFAFTRSEPVLRAQLFALACGAAVISAWAVAGYVALGGWKETAGYGGVGNFATDAVSVLPALVVLAGQGRAARFAAGGVFAVLAVASVLSAQRILWPVLAVQLLIALWLARRAGLLRVPARTLVLATVAVAVVGGTIMLVAQSMRFQQPRAPVASGEMVDADTRWRNWPKVTARIMEHPWTGAGFGRQVMMHAYPDLVPPENPYFWHAHNTVLNYGLSMGLPGMAALLFLFLSLLRQHWKLLRHDDATVRLIGIAGTMLVVGVFLRNQVNDFFVRDGALLFWALNGALLGAALRRASGREAR